MAVFVDIKPFPSGSFSSMEKIYVVVFSGFVVVIAAVVVGIVTKIS